MVYRFHLAACIWAFIIAVLALIPANMFPDEDLLGALKLDKLIHFLEYFILCLLVMVGFKKHYFYGGFNYHPNISAIVACVFFGCIIELLQNFVTTRSFEWKDILANNAGILAGVIVFRWIYGKRLFYA
ncbi:MAG: VanZ family protein [Luteibaculum sp.]